MAHIENDAGHVEGSAHQWIVNRTYNRFDTLHCLMILFGRLRYA